MLVSVDADHSDQLVGLARGVVTAQRDSGIAPPGWTAIQLEPVTWDELITAQVSTEPEELVTKLDEVD
jgi:hypothetical protein